MSKGKNGNITIANIIAMIGLAGIGVVSFFGILVHSEDGTPGGAVLGAVALTAVLAFFLIMGIKAKSTEDNPDKWKWVGWGCVIAYIIIAILFANPFQRFFYVVSEKEELKSLALQEVKAIDEIYSRYEFQKNKFMTDAAEQLANYRDSRQLASANRELAEYVDKVHPIPNVEAWKEKALAAVKLEEDTKLKDIKDKIGIWNLMTLSSLANELEERDAQVLLELETKIREYGEKHSLIPVIGGGGIRPYTFEGYAQFDLGERPRPEFAEKLRSADGATTMGWIVYVILHLLVLLNYAVTEGSEVVGPRRGKKGPGTEL